MGFYLLKGKAGFFHYANRVQIIKLGGAVVAVSVIGVNICGTEKPDFIIKYQGLTRNILML